MTIHDAEIQAIVDNPAKPTFENTIVALERSGKMLGRVGSVFGALTGANTNATLDATDAEISPKLTAHYDAISLDPQLFARVKAVYDMRSSLNLDTEDAKLLEERYKGMVHAGAELTPAQKEQVKAINSRLSAVTTSFGQSSGTYDHYFYLFLPPHDVLWSFGKVLVFATLVMLIHCYYGYNASGGPAGVGLAVGRAVRTSLVVINIVDLLMGMAIWGTTTTVRIAG